MYIDASTIITAASVVGGLGVLGGAVAHVVRIVQRDKRQSAAIKAMQEEQTIICYGLRGIQLVRDFHGLLLSVPDSGTIHYTSVLLVCAFWFRCLSSLPRASLQGPLQPDSIRPCRAPRRP